MNAIDTLIGFFAPEAAMRRARARVALDIYARKYEAAGNGRRTDSWKGTNAGPNTINEVSLDRLRARSRDAYRNQVYARNTVLRIAANVIGTGIQPNPDGQSSASKKKVKELWRKWAETKECDYDGQQNIYGLQRMAMQAIVRDGEVIIRRRRVSGGTLPIRLQVQEADVIDTRRNYDIQGGGKIIQGVEFNKDLQRVAYWLYDGHPEETGRVTSRRVPASDVMHVYYKERPGQVRGVPWMAASMIRLKDYDDYEDAELIRQKIAACFTVFVTDSNPDSVGLGGSDNANMLERVEPGIVEVLPSGKTVEFANPPTTQNYDSYSRKVLQGVAAGVGISYEALTGDLSGVNFSSGRMGWIEMQRNIEDWQFNMVVPMLCDTVWDWFLDAGYLAGRIPSGAMEPATWTPPRREMIDPTREIPAQINAVRGGIMSLQEVHRQNGYDSDQVLQQMADDNKRIDNLGLILDSDARKTMKAGITQSFLKQPSQAAGFEDTEESPPTPPAE